MSFIASIILIIISLFSFSGKSLRIQMRCLSSFSEFAYMPNGLTGEKIPPSAPWQPVATLPKVDPLSYGYPLQKVLFARDLETGIEIWIETPLGIFIYMPQNQQWLQISQINDNSPKISNIINVQGGIWKVSLLKDESNNTYLQFSLFNDLNFQFIPQGENVLLSNEHNQTINRYILMTFNDNIYVIISYMGIYRYNTSSKSLRLLSPIDFNVMNASITSDGNLYLLRSPLDITTLDLFSIQQDMLLYFDTIAQEFSVVEFPNTSWPIIDSILIDSMNRLWLGATGYRDAQGAWHLLHPTPEFFFNHVGELYTMPAHLMLASSDGRLWYVKSLDAPEIEGTAWYDPETGEGCMFTNLPGYIVEDSQQRLWMIVNNTLYQYDLSNVE